MTALSARAVVVRMILAFRLAGRTWAAARAS